MNISWNISDKDIKTIRKVLKENNGPFTNRRRERNIEKKNVFITQETILKTIMMCLLTSQQRSGPNSKVGLFLRQTPFPISSEIISSNNDIQNMVYQILKENGLTRYINRVSQSFASNIKKMQNDKWSIIQELKSLKVADSKEKERHIADRFQGYFDGFGPKQSRNFLQSLGLTKYEIPIDSRIINWLNNFDFPITLTSSALSDLGYYHFISDGIQVLCKQAEIYPCLLDAAIFSSYDNGEWTEENIMI